MASDQKRLFLHASNSALRVVLKSTQPMSPVMVEI